MSSHEQNKELHLIHKNQGRRQTKACTAPWSGERELVQDSSCANLLKLETGSLTIGSVFCGQQETHD
ncbi:hypothetical protein PGTUg99_025209 [Puccinia graminis f. sp. tritici]|uniref:Uncharacterized protein n=1 Tax=Puccinia graminis f. sp. tritici TaxID=56615 RepID=A0A5B0SCX7_PUCGR|nr:hypothetical protein PGTUg99_025209 [Puccinia graminis f. sp. tritici]